MDIEDIQKHYERMSNSQFILLLTTNAHGLRPEVFSIIEKEIEKRNLDPNLLKGALAQNKEYSLEEIEVYSKLLQDLPCPICKETREKLNGTISHTVISFIVFTSSRAEPIIACPNCLDKKNKRSMISTFLLGWWGFPFGILKTPIYIYRNYKAKKENHISVPNNTLLSYTLENIGQIETHRNDKKMLQHIIKPQ